MTVLILAREIEPQVDRVVEELAVRGVPVFRTNLAAFPQKLTLDARLEPDGWNGMLATERRTATEVGGPLAGRNLSAASLVESGHLQTAYTRRLEAADLTDLSGVETTAHLFQQFVDDKAFEVRATVVGKQVFAAAIHAGSAAARIDFRADYPNLDYSVIEPPVTVHNGMRAFMRTFDLSFGAFDFAVTTGGEWII